MQEVTWGITFLQIQLGMRMISFAQAIFTESNENNNVAYQAINVACSGGTTSPPAGIVDTDITLNDKVANVDIRNYPNPFNEQTTIEFTLEKDVPVTLFVSDMTGKQIAILISDEQKLKGTHQAIFDGNNYPAGMYYYTIQAGDYVATQKMTLVK